MRAKNWAPPVGQRMMAAPGVFLILVARAPATVWDVRRSADGRVIGTIAKKTWHVNHYSFHIMDPVWGHLAVKMSGHPPFGAQVILNGQYAEQPAMPHRVVAGLVGEPIAPGFAA
jgi:hypothetical protein